MTDDDVTEVAHLDRQNLSSWATLHFSQHIKAAHSFHFIARQTQTHELCGFICGQLLGGEAEIHKIAVAEKYQRQAIGTALLHKTITFLKNQSAHSCFLELRRSNLPARRLYAACKFQPVAVRKKYYSSPVEDAIIMKLHDISPLP
jgi:ribosomal-protein-alanine N-acetyltransferase